MVLTVGRWSGGHLSLTAAPEGVTDLVHRGSLNDWLNVDSYWAAGNDWTGGGNWASLSGSDQGIFGASSLAIASLSGLQGATDLLRQELLASVPPKGGAAPLAAPGTLTETPVFLGDDIGDTIGTASTISVNSTVFSTVNGVVSGQQDLDFFRVSLVAGQTYTINLEKMSVGSTLDCYLELRNSAGTIIAQDDDSGIYLNSALTFTASSTGDYYLVARAFNGTTFGDYALSINTLTTGNTSPTTFPSNGLPQYSWDQAAIQIDTLFQTVDDTNWPGDQGSWSARLGVSAVVTYAFRATAPTTMPGGTAGFSQFNASQIAAAEHALAAWAAVANITFVRVDDGGGYSNNATILFGNYSSGAEGAAAFAFVPVSNDSSASSLQGDVWVNISLAENSQLATGQYGALALLHEIGHAIGLNHPGDYNADPGVSPTYGANAVYFNDTRMFTVMSYFGSSNTGGVLPAYGTVPQLHDIAAVQRLYGANLATRTGDTIYGFNSDTGVPEYSLALATQGAVFAIWDGGGNDTLDLSGYSTNSTIDLRQEAFSSAGPGNPGSALYNISIARGVVIENAVGGSGNDNILGNDADNVLTGNAGADTLNGGDGNDTAAYDASNAAVTINLAALTASGGHAAGDTLISIENAIGSSFGDSLTGSASANTLNGGAGNDTLAGLAGADVLIGGSGFDTANYAASGAGVTVNLGAATASGGDAAGDTMSSIENVTGSAFIDVLTGTETANTLQGLAGADTLNGAGGDDLLQGGDNDDVLIGGAGNDTLAGGAGNDTADYSNSAAGITANLTTGLGSGGDAQGDSYGSIERVIGTSFNDVLIGKDFVVNVLNGGDGDDFINGNVGADTLIGGNGVDTLDYSTSPNGVDIRLFNGLAAGGSANGDVYSGFENIRGSNNFTDTLAGDDGANSIWGGGGNETITGRDGNDYLLGENGNDTLLGGAGQDYLVGGAGADTLGGGADDDTVDYSNSASGVTVNLATGVGSGGDAQGDAFVSIEDVVGSAFDDVIIGKANSWDNRFDGGGGNDTLTGGNGDDAFIFRLGDGSDTVTDFAAGGASGDVIEMKNWGAAFDTFVEMMAVASQAGADVVFNFGNGQTLTLQNVLLANLNSSDFVFG